VGAVPEVRASIIDASSRFTSVAASVIRMPLDEISGFLDEKRALPEQIRRADKSEWTINLSSKALRKVALARNGDKKEFLKERTFQALYRAVDG